MLGFGAVLAGHLERRGMSGGAFARLVQANQSHVSKILRGERPPPLGRLERWADLLGLDDEECRRFRIAGQLGHCPAGLDRGLIALARQRGPRISETDDALALDEAQIIADLALLAANRPA